MYRRRNATKIILLRHAEKPDKDFAPYGVTQTGERNKESLQVRGWQRAGALITLLVPPNGQPNAFLDKPRFLFASKPLRHKGSRRPLETLIPLAEKLAIKINTDYPRFDFKSMLEKVFLSRGVVMICWQHQYLPDIALKILDDRKIAPANWPEDRFDMFWVFDLDPSSDRYTFKQVPQKLLSGDSGIPIRQVA